MSDLIRREDAIAATELECNPDGDDDIIAAGMLIRLAIRDLPAVRAVEQEKVAELTNAIETLRKYASETRDYWDSDLDAKVGKRLAAMAGRTGYNHAIDAVLALRKPEIVGGLE